MNGVDDGPGPAIVPVFAKDHEEVQLRPPQDDEVRWDAKRLKRHCRLVLMEAAECIRMEPHRLIYAMAGKVFVVTAPKPIGGKPSPGFKKFRGETPEELLGWILDKAVEAPLSGRGRKKVPPGTVLGFVVAQINEVIKMKSNQEKDAMDDTVLRGMFRSGHLPETGGKIVLPEYLRDRANDKEQRPAAQKHDSRQISPSSGIGKKRRESLSDSETSSKRKRSGSQNEGASRDIDNGNPTFENHALSSHPRNDFPHYPYPPAGPYLNYQQYSGYSHTNFTAPQDPTQRLPLQAGDGAPSTRPINMYPEHLYPYQAYMNSYPSHMQHPPPYDEKAQKDKEPKETKR
ncbi:hypothetical protein HDU67_006318 [Dinochytrium kinnereticum]|nr:hypothetical protein HDU67_006318 [Dinochytrium kinnereticum]